MHTSGHEERTPKFIKMRKPGLAFPYNLMAQEGEALSYQSRENMIRVCPYGKNLLQRKTTIKDYHLWNLGLNLEKTGKPADAMQVYDQIIAGFC
ncbi:MAG: hypothetical protein R3A45_13275 [Bdellovibrionota bacterium]